MSCEVRQFNFYSYQKAINAIKDGILPITAEEVYLNKKGKRAVKS